MYEIKSKSDFEIGASLVICVPESELDKKSLYTILEDKPEFLIPFRHRSVEGQIEFTYQIGNRSKIKFLSGKKSIEEYVDLWFGVMQPLIDYWDWFLNPYSFVLLAEHLYYDKTNNSIYYIYVPSMKAFSDNNALKNMILEIEKNNEVTDVNLQKAVLRAFHDFAPGTFLQMLSNYKAGVLKTAGRTLSPKQVRAEQQTVQKQVSTPQAQPSAPKPQMQPPPMPRKATAGSEPHKWSSEQKTRLEQKEKDSLPNRDKILGQEIIEGAAAMPNMSPYVSTPSSPSSLPGYVEGDADRTELEIVEKAGTKLRYIGNKEHPRIIDVNVPTGGIFTIGRFDASVGTAQSSFEFEKRTKAVSRRHAAIEHRADGHYIIDLDSAAGTFLDGRKLPPNASFKLIAGSRVSFGHSGADYVWEK